MGAFWRFFWQPQIVFGSIFCKSDKAISLFVVGSVGADLFHLEFFITIHQVWNRWNGGGPYLWWLQGIGLHVFYILDWLDVQQTRWDFNQDGAWFPLG